VGGQVGMSCLHLSGLQELLSDVMQAQDSVITYL